MLEKWKDIKNYEGLYQISNLGRIKNIKKNKILKNRKITGNYLGIILYKNGNAKNYKVHRLVAQAFIPNPNNLPCINHKDFNKQNNKINNLEWCTYKYNTNYTFKNGNIEKIIDNAKRIGKKYGGNKKAIEKSKKKLSKKVYQYDLNGNFIKEWESAMEIERNLKIANSCISNCCNGKRKSAGGYIWKH